MGYITAQESFDSLAACWSDPGRCRLNWDSVFVVPAWQEVWWREFGSGHQLCLTSVRHGETIAGIAPLMVKDDTAYLLGGTDVCDYLDFVVAPGRERDFFNVLLDDLRHQGINHLDLGLLRPDSTVLRHLVGIAEGRGYQVIGQSEDVSLEMELPADWEAYLTGLTTKQRHEVRRKLRRLDEAGEVNYRFVEDSAAVPETMDMFLGMFTGSRDDKADFLTAPMESFLRALADKMAEIGLLKIGILELDRQPVAAIMCFDYNECLYLYNSGYNLDYRNVGAGLLSKVLCIQESIQQGKTRFDFLKGNETYKYHLGGREIPLSRCRITIK